MTAKAKQILLVITLGALIFAGILNLDYVLGALSALLSIFLPVLGGFVLAFMLNVPMRGIEGLLARLAARAKRPPKTSLLRLLSLLLTILFVLLLLFLLITLVIPALAESVTSLYNLVLDRWPEWSEKLSSYGFDPAHINHWLDELDLKNLAEKLSASAGSLISSAATAVGSVVTWVFNATVMLVIAIYALLAKGELSRHADKLLRAYTKPATGSYLRHVGELFLQTYSKFLSGQCLEACILGTLIFLVFTVLGIPYAGLIGILAAVFSFIPYIGAFAACAIGALLVLLADPGKFLLCILVYLVVQFVENQFIYPHVVGSSVGLSPLWTLVAVLVGGNIMGLLGMIFFIPLTSVLITLIKECTNRRLAEKAEQ